MSGFALHYVKPMLVAEVRRILPTSVGLPMELSFYTTAVAAASVECDLQIHFQLTVKFILLFLELIIMLKMCCFSQLKPQ